MQAATYEMLEAFEEDYREMRAPQLREMTSKQKFNTGARYRRRGSSAAGASGRHRRRRKVSCC